MIIINDNNKRRRGDLQKTTTLLAEATSVVDILFSILVNKNR